jgi:hypothetical protein
MSTTSRYITEGALVEVTSIVPDGWDRSQVEVVYGIIVKNPEHSQITMFPEVHVYLIKSQKIRQFPIDSIKIISPITDSVT